MGSEVENTTLGQITKRGCGFIQTGPFGSQLHASDYVPTGIPCIMPANIVDGRVNITDIAHITPNDAQRLSKHIVQVGDIVYSRRGDVTRKALIREKEEGMFCGTGCLLVRPGKEIDSRFLAYHLSSPLNHEWIIRHAIGATMPNLNTSILGAVPLTIPDLATQKGIARVLGALDDKIELNHQVNDTLEQMAQALFKSWFADFDPVIDNALDAGNPIPEELAAKAEKRKQLRQTAAKGEAEVTTLPDDIRSLFPNEFVFTEEMGWIPKGWAIECFGDVSVCHDKHRIPLSKKQREEKKPGLIPYYGATSIMDYVNEWIFDDIYLLIGEDGSVMKEDGTPFVQYIWGKSWVNNHAHVLQGKNGISTEHLMLFMLAQNITAYVTGAVQLKINQRNMNSIPFLKADEDINRAFSDWLIPIFEKVRAATEEISSLSSIRDILLPKLISGELQIPDAEKQVAAAL